MDKKFFLNSKIFLLSASGFLLHGFDALNSFLVSGPVDVLCAKRSAISAGLMGVICFIRCFMSNEKLSVKPEVKNV